MPKNTPTTSSTSAQDITRRTTRIDLEVDGESTISTDTAISQKR